ncbi:unnamed protein product, partial [Urochloa humidicola]
PPPPPPPPIDSFRAPLLIPSLHAAPPSTISLSSCCHLPLIPSSSPGRVVAARSPSPSGLFPHQSAPRRDGGMRLRIAGNKTAASDPSPAAAAAPVPAAADGAGPASFPAAGAPVVTAVAGPAGYHSGTENGSKDESFFEARPWLDSDSEDDFYSVRGDFTPSRNSTPDHSRLITSFSGRVPVDRSKPSLIQKKQRLLDLLQEKQHYDDDDDSTTDDSSDLENGAVHAEEHMKTSRKGKKSMKSSRSGCFPSLIWSRKKRKEQKDRM